MSELSNFTKGIADAIREKEGSTDLINPQDFADRISGLSSGEIGLIKK